MKKTRFSNVTIQRQTLDYYKDMEKVAAAAIALLESSTRPLSLRLIRLEMAVKKIRHCEKEALSKSSSA